MGFDFYNAKSFIRGLEQERDDLAGKIEEMETALSIKDYAISMQEGKIERMKDIADERDKFTDSLVKELSEVQDLYENALKTIEVEAFTRAMLVDKCKRLKKAALGVRKLAEDISEEPDTLAKDKAYQRLNKELE